MELSKKEFNIQQRLNDALQESGKNKADIARYFNVQKSAVGQWFNKKVPFDRLPKLAKFLRVDYLWLICEGENKPVRAYSVKAWDEPSDLDKNDILIPVYNIKLSAGNGIMTPEYVKTKHKLPFNLNWIQKKGLIVNDLKLMKVKGESMNPVLNDNDMVLINTAKTNIVDGKIYALIIGQETKIKRLKRTYDGSLVVMSDNKASMYQDETISPENMKYVFIIGLAVHRSGDI